MNRLICGPNSLRPLSSIFDDMLGVGRNLMSNAPVDLRPALDIHEDDDAFHVSVDLPGIKKEDVEVSFEDGVLTLAGEKRAVEVAEGSTRHVRERSWGRFARRLTLPKTVDGEKASARFEDGVLLVTLPKREQVKPRRLTIE